MSLAAVEFGNRTNTAWSGWACCRGGRRDRIFVRIGGDNRFPTRAKTHRGGFTIGRIEDRLEALIKVTAHEVAHCEQAQRNVTSRQSYNNQGSTAGSEADTDRLAGSVLTAFREKRDELVAKWSTVPTRTPAAKKSPVQVRAEKAFTKEIEWKKKLAGAERLLKKWRNKAAYYRRTYPKGEYPKPVIKTAAESAT